VRLIRTLAVIVFVAGSLSFGRFTFAQQDQTQTGDTVAAAARKTREQKKNAPKPKKVLTDDDVAPKPAESATSAVPSDANPDAAAPTAVKPEVALGQNAAQKEDPNSEKAWRKRFAAQRKKIADAEQELDVLQRESDKASVQYYSDPQKAMNEQFTRNEINEKNDKIAAKKKDLASLRQQLSDMEDEVRRAGGDPGWAR
jgi:chromosome segregation ATPase